MFNNHSEYDSPRVEVVELIVEQGFAASGDQFNIEGDFITEEEEVW